MKKDNVYKAVVFHDGKVIILSGEIAGMHGNMYYGACYNSDGSVGLAENDESLRIIASNYLPQYPTIDFNHVNLGIVDIERVAGEYAFCYPATISQDEFDMLSNGFYSGYERCLSDNTHKRFNEADMAKFGQHCIKQFEFFRNHDSNYVERLLSNYIKEVFMPKIFDIEIEIEVDGVIQTGGVVDWMPKIKYNQIKIIKTIQPCTD